MKKYYQEPNLYAGIVMANLFSLTVIGLTKYFFRYYWSTSAYFVYSDFILVPVTMGIICAWFWRKLELKNLAYVLLSLLTALAAVFLSYIFLSEGYICLLIVSPLLFGFAMAGAFIGKAMFRKKNNTLNVSVLSLLALFFTIDSLSDHKFENVVSDTILIHAKPEEVWKHVVAFEPITKPADYFLFRIGMPSPVESTVDGYYEGAGRKCIFSNGYVFDEKMVIYKPGENLTFDIINQPRDPEIMGHIDILRGQFLLHDNGDGTTTLTGNSWYRLYVFPSWYYDLWAQSITSHVHLRAMQHIKELSEKK
jgi:hypothetical protein